MDTPILFPPFPAHSNDEDTDALEADTQVEASANDGDDSEVGEAGEAGEVGDEGQVIVLNEASEVYRVLERRLKGTASEWPSNRRDEFDRVLRDRLGDFLDELPETAVAKLVDVALGVDPLVEAS